MTEIQTAQKTLEKKLIEHSAPTLAGIKCASLFTYFYSGEQLARRELIEANRILNAKGVYVQALIWREKSVLIYVYREAMLEEVLAQSDAWNLLRQYGYQSCEVKDCLEHLRYRLFICDCFPHEIGIFLGYPLEDVRGFIENEGKNCANCCGMWKVYCDREEKERLFQKLQKCKDIYLRVFSEGRQLAQMTVCS